MDTAATLSYHCPFFRYTPTACVHCMESPAPLTDNGHLLLVDDQLDELRVLIELLRQANYRISVAFDGAQAYQRAVARMPDLILMDVRMPGTDGFAACRLLKSNPATARIPVLFLSSMADLDHRLEGLENGGSDYVLKPFEPAEVLARIRIHLGAAPAGPACAVGANPSHDEVLVQAARRHLATRLSEPPRLGELARRLGTHEKRLTRAFRAVLGMTVFEYLQDQRLGAAAGLLAGSSLSVALIAEETGFSSAANLATAFRLRYAMTPTAYRARAGAAGP